MHAAIATLMTEHRLIERVLAALEATADDAREGRQVSRARVADLATFFATFADRCHHGKEEDLLFKRLAERGLPVHAGPLAVMLSEHQQGREHVRAFVALGKGEGPLTALERASLVSHAEAYAPLLAQHIQKEDRVLYPMALEMLGAADLDDLERRYEDFEAHVMGEGEHQRLHALAERIAASAPGAHGTSAEHHCACGGH